MKKKCVIYKIICDEKGNHREIEISSEEELNSLSIPQGGFIQNTKEGLKRHMELFESALLEAEKAFK